MLGNIFGSAYNSIAQQQINHSASGESHDDNVYPISNFPNDPIINGPFGNISGTYWGEDNGSTGTIVTTQLPPFSIQIATAYNQFSKYTVDPSFSTV